MIKEFVKDIVKKTNNNNNPVTGNYQERGWVIIEAN